MKSIKEKAVESSLGYDEVQAHAIGRGFVLGANYVLGEILDKTSKCITVKDAYEAFLECVEQLKK